MTHPTLDPALRADMVSRLSREAIAAQYDIRLVDLRPGYAKVDMVITEQTQNMFGLVHGAAVFALIDEAFQLASNSHGTLAVALNVSVNFLSSPAVGARVTAEAKELSRTKRTATYDIKTHDDSGALVATCQALAYRKGTPFPQNE